MFVEGVLWILGREGKGERDKRDNESGICGGEEAGS